LLVDSDARCHDEQRLSLVWLGDGSGLAFHVARGSPLHLQLLHLLDILRRC
jgi:hypothetical protein